jgi:hypothetical protein
VPAFGNWEPLVSGIFLGAGSWGGGGVRGALN